MVSNAPQFAASLLCFICTIISHQQLVTSMITTDDTSDDFKVAITERYCSSLLDQQHLPFDFKLPSECRQFSMVKAKLQRKQSNQVDANIAFAGLSPAEAAQAQVARERGRHNEAQIKRRLTSRSKDSSSSWFQWRSRTRRCAIFHPSGSIFTHH